jgi:hypothetical protein
MKINSEMFLSNFKKLIQIWSILKQLLITQLWKYLNFYTQKIVDSNLDVKQVQ